ncbi:MAG: M48 family metallopeptidase [Oscillospiraceae bacterium]|nr:M48 family metallopeptidase [Oscillospiraceae bacterium]
MFEDIRKNKMKSHLVVGCFILVITLIIYYLSIAFDVGASVAITFALAFSIPTAWASYYFSDKIVIKMTGAKPATMEENKRMIQSLEAIMLASGLTHTPRLYVINDPQPNAFATGRNPKNAVIGVTTGLLEKLDHYELEAVLAHELAHIKNYDIRLSAILTVMVGVMVMLSDIYIRTFLWGGGNRGGGNNRSGSGSSGSGKGQAILMVAGLVLLIIAPILARIMKMSVSRRREFLADTTAVQFTRNPDGLISALQKLDGDPNEMRNANRATENMYIVNPFRNNRSNRKKACLFSTHPSIPDRVSALQNLS